MIGICECVLGICACVCLCVCVYLCVYPHTCMCIIYICVREKHGNTSTCSYHEITIKFRCKVNEFLGNILRLGTQWEIWGNLRMCCFLDTVWYLSYCTST